MLGPPPKEVELRSAQHSVAMTIFNTTRDLKSYIIPYHKLCGHKYFKN